MPESPPAPGARRRVLLVEDEAMIAMLVEDMLDDLGHVLVAVAARLDEALAAARTVPVDVAILDLNLGGVLSYPVADLLAKRGIPFVFATGYGGGGLKEAYADRPTLHKPFVRQALGDAIALACGT